jgi:hypothetical protein
MRGGVPGRPALPMGGVIPGKQADAHGRTGQYL